MNKRGRPSRLSKKKAARIKWSRNANAAKARKRLERPERGEVPRMVRSGRHAKAFLDAVFLYEA